LGVGESTTHPPIHPSTHLLIHPSTFGSPLLYFQLNCFDDDAVLTGEQIHDFSC
jgi:hypothetical protein